MSDVYLNTAGCFLGGLAFGVGPNRLSAVLGTRRRIRYALNHRDALVRSSTMGASSWTRYRGARHQAAVPQSQERAFCLRTRWRPAVSRGGLVGGNGKLNGVDPQRYFTDRLTRRVNGWPNSRIDELMAWCWATAENG